MLRFLNGLIVDGRVRVSAVEVDDDDSAAVERSVRAVDAVARAESAGDAPPLSVAAATWALRLVEAGCRFLVYRAYDADAIAAALSHPCPEPAGPAACYSADLFLRHLPDLVRLARGLAADEPLVARLMAVARQWPLSSVGLPVPADAALDVRSFAGHPALLQLYVDRVLARGDAGRLASSTVRRAVRRALGGHAGDLAPALAAALDVDDD